MVLYTRMHGAKQDLQMLRTLQSLERFSAQHLHNLEAQLFMELDLVQVAFQCSCCRAHAEIYFDLERCVYESSEAYSEQKQVQ